MPSQKRSRHLRRERSRIAREGHPTEQRRAALKAAAAARDKSIRDARAELEPKIAELQQKLANRRREAWNDYDARRDLIYQAQLIGAEA